MILRSREIWPQEAHMSANKSIDVGKICIKKEEKNVKFISSLEKCSAPVFCASVARRISHVFLSILVD